MSNKKKLPCFCHMYFGAPGSGKTTFAVYLARKYKSIGYDVYTNFPCKGTYRLDSADIGKSKFENSLVIVDEAGIDFNNRDFKSFPKEVNQYVKLHRHYGTSMVFLSQGWDDCDKKIRTLCSHYFFLRKLGPFTLLRRIAKVIDIDDEGQIVDKYKYVSLFQNGLKVILRRKYYKYFDSWDAPALPAYPKEKWYKNKSIDMITVGNNTESNQGSREPERAKKIARKANKNPLDGLIIDKAV